jgi:uncharacterized protein YcnI
MSSLRAAALAALAALAAVSAHAHVLAEPDEGAAGAYLRSAFRVTHGCKGSPTVAVTIRLPPEVIQAKPMPKPGWTVDIKTRALDQPVDSGHGFQIRQAVTEVTWRGGHLDNAHFDEFVLSLRLPQKPGVTLYFATLQTCEGSTQDWSQIPTEGQAWHALPSPAPFVKVKAAGHAH